MYRKAESIFEVYAYGGKGVCKRVGESYHRAIYLRRRMLDRIGIAEGGLMMDEYISRVETVKLLQALIGAAVTGQEQALVEAAVHVAESVPKADVKQVRHGRWVRQDDTFTRYKCSVCLSENHGGYEQYCSICGSKMKPPKGVGRLEIPH